MATNFGAEMDAMFREMVNSVRGAAHQAAWGQPEAGMALGVPLNPTPQAVHQELTAEQSEAGSVYGQALDQARAQAQTAEAVREPELER